MYCWPAASLVALDCEASGIDPARDVIWQYAIYGVGKDGRPLDVSGVVRNDAVTTGRNPRRIPGIDKREWELATPITEGHLDRMHAALDGATVWCHKRAFDWELVKSEFRRHRRKPPRPTAVRCSEVLCRYRLRLPPPNDLKSLCSAFDIHLETWHNAQSDARATFQLVVKLANLHWHDWFDLNDAACWAVRSKHWPPSAKDHGGWVARLQRTSLASTRVAASAALAEYQRRVTRTSGAALTPLESRNTRPI